MYFTKWDSKIPFQFLRMTVRAAFSVIYGSSDFNPITDTFPARIHNSNVHSPVLLHSQKELAHSTADITVKNMQVVLAAD